MYIMIEPRDCTFEPLYLVGQLEKQLIIYSLYIHVHMYLAIIFMAHEALNFR